MSAGPGLKLGLSGVLILSLPRPVAAAGVAILRRPAPSSTCFCCACRGATYVASYDDTAARAALLDAVLCQAADVAGRRLLTLVVFALRGAQRPPATSGFHARCVCPLRCAASRKRSRHGTARADRNCGVPFFTLLLLKASTCGTLGFAALH